MRYQKIFYIDIKLIFAAENIKINKKKCLKLWWVNVRFLSITNNEW